MSVIYLALREILRKREEDGGVQIHLCVSRPPAVNKKKNNSNGDNQEEADPATLVGTSGIRKVSPSSAIKTVPSHIPLTQKDWINFLSDLRKVMISEDPLLKSMWKYFSLLTLSSILFTLCFSTVDMVYKSSYYMYFVCDDDNANYIANKPKLNRLTVLGYEHFYNEYCDGSNYDLFSLVYIGIPVLFNILIIIFLSPVRRMNKLCQKHYENVKIICDELCGEYPGLTITTEATSIWGIIVKVNGDGKGLIATAYDVSNERIKSF